jgi:hypothetical protein
MGRHLYVVRCANQAIFNKALLSLARRVPVTVIDSERIEVSLRQRISPDLLNSIKGFSCEVSEIEWDL